MNEAYVLLNVDYKMRGEIAEAAGRLPAVRAVKTVYGICDVLVVLESEDMREIKSSIDEGLHGMKGITNMTSLISVG